MPLHARESAGRDATAGATLLFIHGFPFDGSMWDRQLEAVPAGWRAVAPDLRGFGRTPLDADGVEVPTGAAAGSAVAASDEPVLTMDRHADDLAALLDARGGGPAVVCGLSMGGYIAFSLLRRHPRLVRALVLADTRAGADGEEGRGNRRRSADAVRRSGPRGLAGSMIPTLLGQRTREARADVVERVRRMILGTPPATLIGALAGMADRPDSTPLLAEIAVPTLVVVGADDALTPPDVAEALSATIPGARLEIVPDAGHLAPLENPAAFNAVLEEFLAQI